jgi:N-glycosidase YbiA
MSRIEFYRVNEPCGEFSNFAPFPIDLDGKLWPTSEHYFQAQKFVDRDRVEAIRATPSPMIAARMGRSRNHLIRDDWDRIKDDVMHRAVLAKFSQHVSLRDLLLGTADAEIVEHTKNDSYWGDGGDGTGRNMLGRILMQVRAQLRTPHQAQAP